MGDADEQDNALAAFGLELIDTESNDIEVWPENWQTMLIFSDMLSQWNVGMSGVIGLRYESLPLVFRIHGIKREKQREIFDGLRIMECVAISIINER